MEESNDDELDDMNTNSIVHPIGSHWVKPSATMSWGPAASLFVNHLQKTNEQAQAEPCDKQGSDSSVGTKLGVRPTPVSSPLWPNGDRAASCGTPAPGAGSSSKTGRSMTRPGETKEAIIEPSDTTDPQETTMNTELEDEEASVWGADWCLDVFHWIWNWSALQCCIARCA